MFFQIAGIRRSAATWVAFVWPFSGVTHSVYFLREWGRPTSHLPLLEMHCTANQSARHWNTPMHITETHNTETHQCTTLKHTNAQHWNTTMHITCCFKQQELLPPKVLMSGDWITWLDCIDQVLLLIAFHFSKFYQWFPIFILVSTGGLPRWHPHSW